MKKKISKKKILSILLPAILLAAVVALCLRVHYSALYGLSFKMTGFTIEYFDYLLSYDVSDYDEETLSAFEEKCSAKFNHLESENTILSNFHNGIMELYENGTTDYSTECFENVMSYYDEAKSYNNLYRKVFGRSLYELGYSDMLSGHHTDMKDHFSKMEEILSKNRATKELLVTYYSWICYNANYIEDGINYCQNLSEKMVSLAEKINYSDMGIVYSIAADTYIYGERASWFIKYMMLALDAYSPEKNPGMDQMELAYYRILCLTNLGIEYANEDNYALAKEYLTEALNTEYEDEIDYVASLKFSILQSLVYVACQTSEFEDAKKYLDKCEEWLSYESKENSTDDEIVLLSTKADYYFAICDYQTALSLYLEALDKYESLTTFKYADFDLDVYNDLGDLYYCLEDYEKALYYYNLVEENILFRGISAGGYLNGLYKTYVALGKDDLAFVYADRYQEYLRNKVAKNQSVASAFLEYENALKEDEINVLKTRTANLIVSLILAIIILTILVSMFINIRKKKLEIQRMRDDFKRLSETDGLTGIYNRRTFDDYMRSYWSIINSTGRITSVVMVDVDYFKKYNDKYGHQAGDRALTSVVKTLQECALEDYFIARYGGEEFVIVMPDSDRDDAREFLEKVQKSLADKNIPHEYSPISNQLTISMGAYVCASDDENIGYESALYLSDEALYKAKETRNTYVIMP